MSKLGKNNYNQQPAQNTRTAEISPLADNSAMPLYSWLQNTA